MYISKGDLNRLKNEGHIDPNIVCYVCGGDVDILWKGNHGDIGLCLEDTQYVATQLLKDVRTGEIDKGLVVKVRTKIEEGRELRNQLSLLDWNDLR